MTLRIGTRGSALALAQARSVADALGGAELVEVVTAGDRGAPGRDKSRWVAELERALLEGEIDLAVHSAKDVPGELAPGLEIVAVPERADPRDALVGGASLDELAAGARVGTSSLRREALLRAARPDLEVVAVRGNVDTRLRKLAGGEWDALVLALAGLARLDRLADEGVDLGGGRTAPLAPLAAGEFVPAAGQGALAVQGRAGESRADAVDHPPSHVRLRAERAFTRAIGADCHTPVGGHASDGALVAFAGRTDGSAWVRDRVEGDDLEALGREVAERMLAAGAREVLA